MASHILTRTFYEGLGALVYALVKADRNIHRDEVTQLGTSLLSSFSDWDMRTRGLRALATFELHASFQTSAQEALDQALQKFSQVPDEVRQSRGIILAVLRDIAWADERMTEDERNIIMAFDQATNPQ